MMIGRLGEKPSIFMCLSGHSLDVIYNKWCLQIQCGWLRHFTNDQFAVQEWSAKEDYLGIRGGSNRGCRKLHIEGLHDTYSQNIV